MPNGRPCSRCSTRRDDNNKPGDNMKWMRCRHQGRELFGVLEGDQLVVHEGDLFGEHRRHRRACCALAGVEWLLPCRAGKMIGAVEQLPRRGREERLGPSGRAAVLPEDAEQPRGARPGDPGRAAGRRPRGLRRRAGDRDRPPRASAVARGRRAGAHLRLHLRQRRDRDRAAAPRPELPAVDTRQELRRLRRARPGDRDRLRPGRAPRCAPSSAAASGRTTRWPT